MKQHKTVVKAGQQGFVNCFKVYCLGSVLVAEQRGVTLVFANICNLLNLFRSIGSCYNVTLQGDVTHKASSAALNKLVYGTNRLGGHFAPLVHALIPAESKSFNSYAADWQAFDAAALIAVLLPACDSPDCKTCSTIAQILGNPKVSDFPLCLNSSVLTAQFTKWRAVAQVCQLTQSEEYKQGSWLISALLFDNIDYGQRFAGQVLKTPASVCQTHLGLTDSPECTLACVARIAHVHTRERVALITYLCVWRASRTCTHTADTFSLVLGEHDEYHQGQGSPTRD